MGKRTEKCIYLSLMRPVKNSLFMVRVTARQRPCKEKLPTILHPAKLVSDTSLSTPDRKLFNSVKYLVHQTKF